MNKSIDQGNTNVIQAQSGDASIRGVTTQIASGYFSPRFLGRHRKPFALQVVLGGVAMYIFPVRKSSCTCCLSRISSKVSTRMRHYRCIIAWVVLVPVAILTAIAAVRGQQLSFIPNELFFPNPGGASQTYSTAGGGIDQTGPFFQSLGTKAVAVDMPPAQRWHVGFSGECGARFLLTQGLDPIFRTVDGSNCNHDVDVSTLLAGEQPIACCVLGA